MIAETDIELPDGRVLHAYDAPPKHADVRLTIVWHHGTPNLGSPPEPLFPVAERLGVRWVGYDRPGYGGSTPNPGRSIGSAAEDVAHLVDALGIDRFAAMGHSGGGAHALACGALLRDRVLGVVCASGLAPFSAEGLDWFLRLRPLRRGGAASGRSRRP